MIVYTIGNTKSYDGSLKNDPITIKIGRTENYSGGVIWLTAEEAFGYLESTNFKNMIWDDGKTRLPENFSVYAVKLDSMNDIVFENNQFYLLKDSQILERI